MEQATKTVVEFTIGLPKHGGARYVCVNLKLVLMEAEARTVAQHALIRSFVGLRLRDARRLAKDLGLGRWERLPEDGSSETRKGESFTQEVDTSSRGHSVSYLDFSQRTRRYGPRSGRKTVV